MKVIVQRIWTEPAVAIGLGASIILAILAVATGADWDASTIAGIAAPFISALGIRETVKPALGKPPLQGETPSEPAPPPPIPPGDPEPGDKTPGPGPGEILPEEPTSA
jgi:hypothetical protein